MSLVGLLMALMLSCKAAPTVATPMPTPTVGIKAYTDEEAKLSIQYPEGWIVERTILEDLNAMIFRETVEEDAPELIVLSGSAEDWNADQILDEALSLIQMLGGEAEKDWQIGEAESVTLGEWQGQRLFAEYTSATSGVRHKVYLVGIVGDRLNYAFVADAPLDDWDKNWLIFEAMLNSLRFLEP
ncbi:MAG: hypothetical protein KAW49_11815 [Anaerolineae bacterium]|nr:hypothetical protein [Anaerolineae bacterium]